MSIEAYISWLAQNPWFVFLNSLVALCGAVLAIVFFIQSRKYKSPRFALRSTNMLADLKNNMPLEVNYASKRIYALTATQVAFWNGGKDTIHGHDVSSIDPVKICMRDGINILDARVIQVSNSAINVSLCVNEKRTDAQISFEFLDKNQGCIIQVIHTGKSNIDVRMTGTIKGYGSLSRCRLIPRLAEYLFDKLDRLSLTQMRVINIGVMIFTISLLFLLVLFKASTHASALVMIFLLYVLIFQYSLRQRIPKALSLFEGKKFTIFYCPTDQA